MTHVQQLLQQAVWNIVAKDPVIVQIVGDHVYTNPPKGQGVDQEYPRIRIGENDLGDFSSHTHNGFDGELLIKFWSRSDSNREIQDMMNQVYSLLHVVTIKGQANDFTIPGFNTINCRCIQTKVMLEPDGKTFQGIQRYSILLGGN